MAWIKDFGLTARHKRFPSLLRARKSEKGSLRRQPIRYTLPLPSSLVELTTKPSFFFKTPEIKPLVEWACHNVAATISAMVAYIQESTGEQDLQEAQRLDSNIKCNTQRPWGIGSQLSPLFQHKAKTVINPPPPAADAAHFRQFPGKFADKLGLGISPDALRIQMYQIQTRSYQAFAHDLGANFVPNPALAIDPRGFLAREYWNTDPTHGNCAYGHLVLDALRASFKA